MPTHLNINLSYF